MSAGDFLAIVLAFFLLMAVLWFPIAGTGEVVTDARYVGTPIEVREDVGLIADVTTVTLKTGEDSSTHETFCIMEQDENSHLPLLRQAMEQSEPVVIRHSRPLWTNPLECSGYYSVVRESSFPRNGADY